MQSVHRALTLLEAVAQYGEVGVTELAAIAGLKVSTTHGLVKTLANRHYLAGSAGRYRIGPASSILVSAWDPLATLGTIIQPAIEELAEVVGHSVTATVVVGRELRKLAYTPAPGPITITATKDGWPNPMMLATGRVLLAHSDEAGWPSVVESFLERESSGWTAERMFDELHLIRRTRLATRFSRGSRGTCAVAVGIWSSETTMVAAIGCSAPLFLADELLSRSTIDPLSAAAAALSAQLGCANPPAPQPDEILGVLQDGQ